MSFFKNDDNNGTSIFNILIGIKWIKISKNKIIKTYVGYTNNLNLRLKKHNTGRGAKSTRGYKWKIIYKKRFYDKRLAMSFEYKLKRDKKKRKHLLSLS